MSESLVDRIRRSREYTVDVKGIAFSYRRPTDIQMAQLHADSGGNYSKYDVVRKFVYGWTLKESDLIADGGDALVVFDDDLFSEWLSDARDFWSPLFEAIMGAYVEYSAARDDAVKN